jgi:hypothetical protein
MKSISRNLFAEVLLTRVLSFCAIRVWCGLETIEEFHWLCAVATEANVKFKKLSVQQAVVLTLIRLRHRLPFQLLGTLFGISTSAASKLT